MDVYVAVTWLYKWNKMPQPNSLFLILQRLIQFLILKFKTALLHRFPLPSVKSKNEHLSKDCVAVSNHTCELESLLFKNPGLACIALQRRRLWFSGRKKCQEASWCWIAVVTVVPMMIAVDAIVSFRDVCGAVWCGLHPKPEPEPEPQGCGFGNWKSKLNQASLVWFGFRYERFRF